jgi:molybdate transport system ATP-binding protein
VLQVRDKGKISQGQAVNWVIPSDGIHLVAAPAQAMAGDMSAQVVEARHLGEVSLLTLLLAAVPGARLMLTLSGAQRQQWAVGTQVHVRLDFDLVHVMPLHAR